MRGKLLLAIVITFSLSCLQELSIPTSDARILPKLEQTRHQIASLLTASIESHKSDPLSHP
jgi:hypothetical protein